MMLPGTACTSPGQFRKLGSVTLTRAISPRSSVATQCVHGPRHASTHPSADDRAGSGSGTGVAIGVPAVVGQPVEHLVQDEQRLLDLPRANHEPRSDVAAVFDGDLEPQVLIRVVRMVSPEVAVHSRTRARPCRRSRDRGRPDW